MENQAGGWPKSLITVFDALFWDGSCSRPGTSEWSGYAALETMVDTATSAQRRRSFAEPRTTMGFPVFGGLRGAQGSEAVSRALRSATGAAQRSRHGAA